jgi:hypothetical protein
MGFVDFHFVSFVVSVCALSHGRFTSIQYIARTPIRVLAAVTASQAAALGTADRILM